MDNSDLYHHISILSLSSKFASSQAASFGQAMNQKKSNWPPGCRIQRQPEHYTKSKNVSNDFKINLGNKLAFLTQYRGTLNRHTPTSPLRASLERESYPHRHEWRGHKSLCVAAENDNG